MNGHVLGRRVRAAPGPGGEAGAEPSPVQMD
jgi:hypothetical protein